MFSALRHRDYRLFFLGQFVSLVGSWMQFTAQSWLVYRLTGDPFQLGMVAFMGQFPIFVLGAYGGAVADRVDRRRLVLLTQALALLQASLLAALTVSGRVEIWHVYALAAALGTINAFDFPARQVMIGELVPIADRHNAIALNSTIVNVSRMIGPSAAGLCIAAFGEGTCFLLNAASYLAVLPAIAVVRGRQGEPAGAGAGVLAEIREGIRYAMREEAIRLTLLALAAASLAAMPVSVLLPLFADRVLAAGSGGLGVLMGFAGLGATAGALLLARRPGSAGLERIVVRTALLHGFALAAFSFSRMFWLSCAFMAFAGMGMLIQVAGINTLLQELSSDRYRGRVMSLFGVVLFGVPPLASFGAGALAARIGAPATVAAGGALCLLSGSYMSRRLPEQVLRRRLRGS